MCGIAGFIDIRGSTILGGAKALNVMGGLLNHRGPDDSGEWISQDQSVGLAHRRLSIIDLSPSASQPMHGANGTSIILNGEIYNYLELRALFKDRWKFNTLSDTETILATYDKYGPECMSQLRGMFAFALWDESKKTLLCARDRFGIKPFYYTQIGETLYFASEAKALCLFCHLLKLILWRWRNTLHLIL